MQQCQDWSLILMSTHFAQHGRNPVNLEFQGAPYTSNKPSANTKRHHSAL